MSGDARKDGHFPQHVQEAITSVLTKLLPSNVEPMLSAPYLRRTRGRPRVGAHLTGGKSRYLELKEQRLAALASHDALPASTTTPVVQSSITTTTSAAAAAAVAAAAAWVAATSVVDGVPVRRGRGRPRKYPVLAGTAGAAAAVADVAAVAVAAAAVVEPAAPVSLSYSPTPMSLDSVPTVVDRPVDCSPPTVLVDEQPDELVLPDDVDDDSVSSVDSDLSDEDSVSTGPHSLLATTTTTTVIVIPPEASYAAIRRLNVARNRELLAQLALPTGLFAPPTPAAAAASNDAAAADAVATPPPASKKEARASRSDSQRDEHYRAPPRRSTSTRKAPLCGNAACSGFCARCVARVNQPIGAAFASEAAASSKPGGAPLTILAPVAGEELEKGSVIRVQWRAASATLLRGVAQHGYVMLVQVTSGKRAIDDYYFPLVYRPGLLSAHTRVAAADADDLPDVPKDGSGRPLPVSGGTGRGRRPKLPTGKRRAQGGATPAFDSDGDQDVAVAHVTGAVYQEDEATLTATLDWTCPWDLEAGEYVIEVGLMRRLSTSFARSEKLIVVGAYADLVLCLCGDTQHREDEERASSYVRCKVCKLLEPHSVRRALVARGERRRLRVSVLSARPP
jgi:hypothetical protein